MPQPIRSIGPGQIWPIPELFFSSTSTHLGQQERWVGVDEKKSSGIDQNWSGPIEPIEGGTVTSIRCSK